MARPVLNVEDVVTNARQAIEEAPRLRLNVTGGSPGYIICSLYQSDNGVNWACAQATIYFGEDWFRDSFGEPFVGRRVEFSLINIHDVED